MSASRKFMLCVLILFVVPLCGCVNSKFVKREDFQTEEQKSALGVKFVEGKRHIEGNPAKIAVISYSDHLQFTDTKVFAGIPWVGTIEMVTDSISAMKEKSFSDEKTLPYVRKEYDTFMEAFGKEAGLQIAKVEDLQRSAFFASSDYKSKIDGQDFLFGAGKTVVMEGVKYVDPVTGKKIEDAAKAICEELDVDAVLLSRMQTRVVKKGSGDMTVTLFAAMNVTFRPEIHGQLWLYSREGKLLWEAKTKTGLSNQDLKAHPASFDELYEEVKTPLTIMAEMFGRDLKNGKMKK